MQYTQHTTCVDVTNKTYPPWLPGPVVAVVAGAIITLFAGGGLTPYTAIPLLLIIIAYCRWWLYDRLVCLGGEHCAVGLLGRVEPPDEKSFPDSFDTDYSINLVLAPHQYQELPADYLANPPPPPPLGTDAKEYYDGKFKDALFRQIADDGIQGELIKEQAVTGDVKSPVGSKAYSFEGYFSTYPGNMVNYTYQPYLHCEFEGGGVYDLYQAAIAALAFATAGAVVCSIPVLGWIACAILEAIAFLITLIGAFSALNNKGQPSVFDPATGETTNLLHPGQDILLVKGDWVFDTAHEGWNELHPIKHCQRVGTAKYEKTDVVDWDDAIASFMVARGLWRYDKPPAGGPEPDKPILVKASGAPGAQHWRDWIKALCDSAGAAGSPGTVASQLLPEE